VTWIDAEGDAAWGDAKEFANKPDVPPVICHTIGLLVKQGRHATLIAGSCNTNGNFSDRSEIPTSLIRAIEVLGRFEAVGVET
jgi:hypothetical protein